MKQLKEFQKTGVKFLIERKTALLADDMGLGKTVQAAAAIQQLHPKKAIIITLATLKINWERELKSWITHDYKYQTLFKTSDIVDPDANIIIVNYDLIIYDKIKSQLSKFNYDIMILDEAHNLSNPEAKRTKRVYSNTGLIRQTKRIYALTGTPVRNRPKDFYITLKVLAPECIEPYTDYEAYATRFCGAYYDSYGGLKDKGASNIEELAERIKPFMLRRTKEEVLKELPPLIEKTIELEMTPEIEEVLNEEIELREDISEFSTNGELGAQAKVRRLLGLAKLPQVYEYIENVLQTEEKIVIFAFHRDVIDSIRTHFKGKGCRVIQGGMTPKLKQMEVDLFVKDPNSRIFIGQFTAAGFGVDGLQKVANNVIFAEVDWVPGNMDQARDRLYRMGQLKPVIAHYLITPETLEDDILQTVIKKKQVITRLMSNTHEKEKEKTDMTLEQSLERIANSLEKLVGVQESMVGMAANAELACNTCEKTEAVAEPKTEEPKKRSAKKKSEPKAETPVVEAEVVTSSVDDLLGLDSPVETEPVAYTLDDIRTKCSEILSTGDKQANVTKISEVFKKFGYAKITDIQEKDFTNVMNGLKEVA